MKHLKKLALVTFVVSLHVFAGVGTSLMQTADVAVPPHKEARLQADVLLKSDAPKYVVSSGVNLTGHFLTNVVEHFFDVDAYMGTGAQDFQVGALGKYNLLPDIEGQVGLSFLGGLGIIYNSSNGHNVTSTLLSAGVLTSKKFSVQEFGYWSPYGGLQLEALINSTKNAIPVTLTFGNKIEGVEVKEWTFYVENFVSLNDSNYGFGLGAGRVF